MITTISDFISKNIYKVTDSKNSNDNLFIGNYDECVRYIFTYTNLNLEILPVENQIKQKDTTDNDINLAIIGSRKFNDYSFAKKSILEIIQNNNISISKIISGGANGSDKIAEIFANNYNIPIEVIKPDWSLGKHAGFVRNTDIIKTSDCVIAFWDGESKGTLDSITKANKLNKQVFIVDISSLNEGIRDYDENNEDYIFDFNTDFKEDIIKLKYNKDFIIKKTSDGTISYYSYKINKNIDKSIRNKLLSFIKSDLQKYGNYDKFINKAVIGLFNNPNFQISDSDIIIIPESSSNLNYDLANKIKNKIPNALFLKDIVLKNEPENVTINYTLLKDKKYKNETIINIEKMIKSANVDGVFKIKKIPPRFRKYILNFLTIDISNRKILNKLVNGKVIVVDDIVTNGTTFTEIKRLLENFATKEIILYSLIG